MHNLKLLVLGNGPSLKKEYFHLFSGITCLGMNAAYRYWERIGWYPEIYCCLDDQVVLTHSTAIAEMVAKRRCRKFFLHQNILTKYPDLATTPDVYILCQLAPGEKNAERCKKFGLRHTPSIFFRSSRPEKLTTGSYSVRFAAFLGFQEIGLIGIDCRYVEIIQGAVSAGGLVLEIQHTPEKNPNYFFDDYQQKGDRYNLPNPSVHQGNLHLQAFEVLKADIAKYHFDLRVNICTEESELFRQNIFPHKDLKAFITGAYLSAVFMPFTKKDLPLLTRNLQRWATPSFAPYIFTPQNPNVELHFAMNSEMDSAAETEISSAFHAADLNRFFIGPVFHYSNLSGLRDTYNRKFKGPVGPEGYMAGPSNQFFDIIRKFSKGLSHIFLMEPDTIPIRANWLDALEKLVAQHEHFWICGSPYRGRAIIKSFTHINGNAIYNIGDAAFQEFIEKTFYPYFYERMQTAPYLCYDILLHDMFLPLYQDKADRRLFDLWKAIAHLLRFTEVIADVSHEEDRAPTALYDLASARTTYPRTYLFHGAVERLLES